MLIIQNYLIGWPTFYEKTKTSKKKTELLFKIQLTVLILLCVPTCRASSDKSNCITGLIPISSKLRRIS